MRKKIVALVSFSVLIILMIILVAFFGKNKTNHNEKPLIIATLFPQYDFAKHVVGDKMDVELLVKAGVETHNYEPTAKDMMRILNNGDMFLYTGEALEPWTEKITQNLKEDNKVVVNVAKNVELIKIEDFEEKHINSWAEHDGHEEHEGHEEIYDEHIWLNLDNSIKMLDSILEEVIKVDPENKDYYEKNAKEYKDEITKLKGEYEKTIKEAKRKDIAVGGEFAYAYLVDEFGLNFASVYDNCGEGEDPSISRIKFVIDYINKNNIPVVYYEELSEGTIAKMISEETKAEKQVLYSIHNGEPGKDTYVSLMRENLNNLKKGLE